MNDMVVCMCVSSVLRNNPGGKTDSDCKSSVWFGVRGSKSFYSTMMQSLLNVILVESSTGLSQFPFCTHKMCSIVRSYMFYLASSTNETPMAWTQESVSSECATSI